jgi:cell division protein FtsZ
MEEVIMNFDYPKEQPMIIKVVGVGGGGGNAVTHMYKEGIRDVSFVLCNTDNQALLKSEVPGKVQLGKTITKGLGAGNKPVVAKQAAEESIDDLKKMLNDETQMVFITAGMGGGTGTGAAPIVARVAKEMGILTVGIVTIPFLFEGRPKILQALRGVEEIKKNVDALLVINNERLRDIYSDLDVPNAFKKADAILTVAAKSISEIITIPGIVNLDFADVNTILKDGGVAIMSSGLGKGDDRIAEAIAESLRSPLLNNNDVFKAKKILLNISFGGSRPLKMEEMTDVHDFMSKFKEEEIEVIWGTAEDENLTDEVKITILATGFDLKDIPEMSEKRDEDNWLIDKEKREIEQAERDKKEKDDQLIDIYYPDDKDKINRPSRQKPVVFAVEDLDNKEFIEAVIEIPAYRRTLKEIRRIEEKSKAKLEQPQEEEEEESDVIPKDNSANVISFL